ncbi:hypothetical protein J1N35_008269 [Gossypium stocksii]|uniref:Uncharacterized protein n=1 Tax=Gossypium stocksii TaxID=47602 RepID=A0A9D3W838_9ROSI|nr:hypothetical protein J1N35_008269 [Gossypium stocksii]
MTWNGCHTLIREFKNTSKLNFLHIAIWHVKVPLIVFTIIGMHEFDQMMSQFEFVQDVPLSPQILDKLHKINLWGRIDEYWPKFHAEVYLLVGT